MAYTAYIRNNSTGEVRATEHDSDWSDCSHYYWTDGNYSCDCNRELCFVRAKGEDEPEDPECGESRYSVVGVKVGHYWLVPVPDRG